MRTRTLFLAILLLSGCELASSVDDRRVVAGVDLDELFAPASGTELAAVEADWASRDVSPRNVTIEYSESISMLGIPSTVTVISHDVAGITHFGAILRADGLDAASAPVIVYSHGSDSGVDILEPMVLLGSFSGISDRVVFVIPSFRDETLRVEDRSWRSDGPASPWDYDVDDALALLGATFEVEPAADPDRVGVVGVSRGADVAMLMDIRDERIDGVFEMFGPTDFLGPFVEDVVEEVLNGEFRNLPGLDVLAERFIQPLSDGSTTIDAARLELIRRSPVLFADALGTLEVHHGINDHTVPVSQAERLIGVMKSLGRAEPGFRYKLYPGGDHHPFTLDGVLIDVSGFMAGIIAGGD